MKIIPETLRCFQHQFVWINIATVFRGITLADGGVFEKAGLGLRAPYPYIISAVELHKTHFILIEFNIHPQDLNLMNLLKEKAYLMACFEAVCLRVLCLEVEIVTAKLIEII